MTEDEQAIIGKILTFDEGIRFEPYQDTKGYWTVGVGHRLYGDFSLSRMSLDQVLSLLHEDMGNACMDAYRVFGKEFFDSLILPRKAAIISMLFNLGLNKYVHFYKMNRAILKEDWETAAKECKDSKWADDVDIYQVDGKGRDDRVAHMFLGHFDPYYDI